MKNITPLVRYTNYISPHGSSSREVEYQISYPEDMSSIPTIFASLFIFHRKNFRKLPGKLRKIFGKFRRKRKTTEIQLYLCGPWTGNIFRSMDSLVLRHPIICTEFDVRSFHSVTCGRAEVLHISPSVQIMNRWVWPDHFSLYSTSVSLANG